MSNEIKIKSNGLRNELKEIRKSIDKLTNTMDTIAVALLSKVQTHEHYEKSNNCLLPCDRNDCTCE